MTDGCQRLVCVIGTAGLGVKQLVEPDCSGDSALARSEMRNLVGAVPPRNAMSAARRS